MKVYATVMSDAMSPSNYRRVYKRIVQLERKYGSGRAVARELDVDHVYLWRVKQNQSIPSDRMMAKLGLEWRVHNARST